ncbi:MAG: hypothetical protein A3B10_00665 [Candidatus Doudnabacteria bacterium RIFCSPLOWO2_01_FULL_44_21]|uniref:Uncharacterized protein n=1 Tax=Candidatus Doudnabacteria bacterium RIFCSPLOWO2_01_FULL_44_21 TaxID=1817841 RepID=A0A1F5PYJ0_9BACT|nr:MAG: hypothetical protein A3B95_00525 [Candidatus Doudnabacteria bacterium RIFCSPHIGHO2_02_FULL_43_13b]OGE94650.1 MAG: hypothetical protein A3B10_00665 [Candidatus Doudnabacteria bacterium RIFCSPLOWO2_01_FULL_44_21]
MTKISTKPVPENRMGQMIDQLWRAVASLETKDEVHDFLHDILTHTELQMLAKRLQVVVMLDEGFKYEEIKKALSISEATISKIQNWRQAFGKGYSVVIERLKNKKKNYRNVKSGRIYSSRTAALRMWKS